MALPTVRPKLRGVPNKLPKIQPYALSTLTKQQLASMGRGVNKASQQQQQQGQKIGPWDPTTDPTLMGLQSAQTANLNSLAAQNLASKKNILMGFGSQELARKLLGNDPFVGLISDNPNTSTSTLAQLAYGYGKSQQGFNEAESAGNLFYGGGRGVGLRDLAHSNLISIANATAGVEGQISGLDESYATAQRQASEDYWNAAMQAYGNFLASRGLR